jgi:hypothetical protein
MAMFDRVLRILFAVIVVILFMTGQIHGKLMVALMIAAGLLVVTSFVGVCPIYILFGINTNKKKNHAS